VQKYDLVKEHGNVSCIADVLYCSFCGILYIFNTYQHGNKGIFGLFFAVKYYKYSPIILMNNIIKGILLITAIFFGQARVNAQTQLEDIVTAIKVNRVPDIMKYCDNVVPITINNAPASYSHSQAEMVLKDFFSKNTPKDLNISNSGTPTNASKFAIGDLETSNGRYSFYILLRAKGSTYMIQEIRFNKE